MGLRVRPDQISGFTADYRYFLCSIISTLKMLIREIVAWIVDPHPQGPVEFGEVFFFFTSVRAYFREKIGYYVQVVGVRKP